MLCKHLAVFFKFGKHGFMLQIEGMARVLHGIFNHIKEILQKNTVVLHKMSGILTKDNIFRIYIAAFLQFSATVLNSRIGHFIPLWQWYSHVHPVLAGCWKRRKAC